MIEKLYHGSFFSDINVFLPLTHFGTFECAKQILEKNEKNLNRISKKSNFSDVAKNLVKTIYEVEVNLQEFNKVTLDDFGTPKPGGLKFQVQRY